MTTLDIARTPTSHLVETYAIAAAVHGEATESGNYRVANRNATIIEAIYRELRARGETALRELLPLLRDARPGVRGFAGAHCLLFAPDQASVVLEALASTPRSLVGLSAEMTLLEWKKGALRFP